VLYSVVLRLPTSTSQSTVSSLALNQTRNGDVSRNDMSYDIMADMQSDAQAARQGKRGRHKKIYLKTKLKTKRVEFSDFSDEYKIKRSVFLNYDKTTRPVKDDTNTTSLYIGMSLYHILDTVCPLCCCHNIFFVRIKSTCTNFCSPRSVGELYN
jgi:hypothetical protein